jgi:hypothetical protein
MQPPQIFSSATTPKGGSAATPSTAALPAPASDSPPFPPFPPFLALSLESHPQFLEGIVPFLDLRSIQALLATSTTIRDTLTLTCGPHTFSIHKPTSPLAGDPESACYKVFRRWGGNLQSLSLHRTPMQDKAALPALLRICRNLRRLTIHDVDAQQWDDDLVADAVLSLAHLEELRLHASDMTNYDRSPFLPIVVGISRLTRLAKLTLFTRLDAAGTDALARFVADPAASRRLVKLKISTSLLASPGGAEVLVALGRHRGLQKLTIMRPEGMGEPIRKPMCALVAGAMVSCRTLSSVHLRRAGMWTDTLSALVPAVPCPNIRNLKLDSNSLAYLSTSYFNDAMDALLSRTPNLEALHLGNNQLDAAQAVALAASLQKHKITRLQNLTLGSNDIQDVGLAAVLKVLPSGMRQLYLHGCDIKDDGLVALREALDRMPSMWGLGLNGNPVGDKGVRILGRALRGRPALRDVGITLSEMTDEGVLALASALATCPALRFVYLYTSGFKASSKVTDEGKAALRAALPEFATPAFDHRLSRYLKQP